MKNNDNQYNEIRKSRSPIVHRITTDVLVNPLVIELNANRAANPTPRKRRINYAKKIAKDDFIMGL